MTDTPHLVMNNGPQPGQICPLDQDVMMIGRDPNNDIVINDPQVSRQHARIRQQGAMIVIEDVGSTNGTFVNGVRLTAPHTLDDGDVVGLGDAITLTYRGAAAVMAEPVGGRPTVPLRPPAAQPEPHPTPPPPSYEPDVGPSPAYPAYGESPAPVYAAPPPFSAEDEVEPEGRQRKTWLLAGSGCLILLILMACIVVFVLDYLRMLPDIFYQPLFWLGLDNFFQ
jgi:predicted component of type VI protein secretion system